jgi:hypothetical protein
MAKKTDYLELVLPELNEFINSWNGPVNQNMESIDDFCSDLYESLVGTSATSTWSSLRGTHGSLADRLDVAINADGTLDLSGSPDLTAIATSAYHGVFSTPVDRLNDTDDRIYDSSQPVAGGRFSPIPVAGPSAGYETLDSGIALRAADFSSHPMRSPSMPWAPGLVVGGAGTLISAPGGAGKVQINGSAAPAVFNIDGYAFRVRENIIFDFNLLSPANNDYIWIYVERVNANYGTANFRYGSGPAAKDLRILQSGAATGSTSGNVFQAAGALFNTATLGRVRPGDVLVIDSGAAAGEYVINALDGTTPDTKLTIKGTFKANLSGLNWHVQDNWHPNIGAYNVGASAAAQPPFVDGRIYIGRVRFQSAAIPDQIVTFSRGGVYDSGWTLASGVFVGPSATFSHDLGTQPTSVEVWFRETSTGAAHRPLVRRTVVTDAAGPTTATLLFPSLFLDCNLTQINLQLFNQTTTPSAPTALFTNYVGADVVLGGAAEIRVIAKR